MLNALNERLRDDYIRDSVAGIERWNKIIEKAGVALRLRSAAQGASTGRSARSRPCTSARTAACVPRRNGRAARARVAADRRGPRVRRVADGPRRRARQVRRTGSRRRRAASTTSRSTSSTCGSTDAAAAMIAPRADEFIRQHLIDPEICIRCNTCEETCPVDAITHDARNYVVDPAKCNVCNECIAPCPTGAIDNWRQVPTGEAVHARGAARVGHPARARRPSTRAPMRRTCRARAADHGCAGGAARSDSRPAPRRRGRRRIRTSTCTRSRAGDRDGHRQLPPDRRRRASDIRHIVLDFGAAAFPVLEGQTIGIVPPGSRCARPAAPRPRLYSVASPRDGERPGYNNLALTVKRVTEDHDGKPVRGVGVELPVRSAARRDGASRRAVRRRRS